MSDKKDTRPLGELSAYERWELPTLNDPNAPLRPRSAVVNTPIKPLTAEDLEKIHQEAYSAGFDEGKTAGHETGRQAGFEEGKQSGHEEGLQQGVAAGQDQISQQIEHLRKLMTQLVDPISEQRKQVELSTLNVALALARTVIHRELKLDSSSIQAALTQIYQSLPKMDQGLVLIINPADKVHVDRVLEAIENKIELKQDAKVMVGGFLLETSSQLIDYTIEKRFQKVVHEMLLNAIDSESDVASLETSTSIKELSDYPADLLDKAEEVAAVEKTEEKPAHDKEQDGAEQGDVSYAGALQEDGLDMSEPEENPEKNVRPESNALPEQEDEAEQNKTDNHND
ncbi:MAG: flagellar assembly protein FliH [Pseudohongiellaceae bacterium]|jgi:flagellar assembly protein FliH